MISSHGRSGGARCRALVVDDHVDSADLLEELLSAQGMSVTVVNAGDAALAALQGETPDVVLLDLCLPGVDGYEIARRIRAGRPEAPPTVIAVSGYADAEARLLSMIAGFDAHVT